MAVWDDVVPKEELERYYAGGMGVQRIGFGRAPALLIVDMSYCFVDDTYLLGDSSAGIPCIQQIQRLLRIARERQIPVFFSTSEWRSNPLERGLWKRTQEVDRALQRPKAYEIVEDLAPLPHEPVVVKFAPSAFHGTDLLRMLIQSRVDTVIVTGMVTSGCVYATAVDAFSYGFRVVIPQEAVADRSIISHKVALMNVHMKYGDVVTVQEVIDYLSSLDVRAQNPQQAASI